MYRDARAAILLQQVVGDAEGQLLGIGNGFAFLKTEGDCFEVEGPDATDQRVFGPHDTAAESTAQLHSHPVGGSVKQFRVTVFEGDLYQAVVGWIAEDSPLVDLLAVEALIVGMHYVVNHLMVRVVGLNKDTSASTMPACATAHLCHLLEGTLERTEIGEVDEIVGIDYSDDAYILEIKSLGHHLGADKDVDALCLEIVE